MTEEELKAIDDMDPGSAEHEAALKALTDAEDEARETARQERIDAPTPVAETPAVVESKPTTEEAKAAAEVVPEKRSKPTGVLSKDGKTVLSYAVVQSARQRAHQAEQARQTAEARAEALEQQIADMNAGKTTATEDDDLEAAVELAAQDVPVMREMHKRLKQAEQQIKTLTTKPADPEGDKASSDPLQDDIDSIPMLAEWQAADPTKWRRAVAIDKALKDSPKWQAKSQVERFMHVTQQVAEEFDITFELEAPAPQDTTPVPNRADPKKVIAEVKRAAPNTLSDLKGGSSIDAEIKLENLPIRKLTSRFDEMSDADIDAHLAKFG